MNFHDFFTTNTWWGKILGGFFGYLLAGPMGALFGILVGNFFDKGLANHFSNPHWLYHSERKEIQKLFFNATFTVMGHIAKADGRVSEQEIKMAQILMEEMRLGNEQKTLAKKLFNEGKDTHFKLDSVLSQLQRECRNNRELLKLFVDIQYRAAQVDGLSSRKIKALDVIFSRLGFAPLHKQYRFYEDFGTHYYEQEQRQRQQRQQYHKQSQYQQHSSSSQQKPHYSPHHTLAQAYALLEVSPEATKQEVKRAYRQSMSRNHPDKLIAQGLPEEMIKIANDKTQKILKAYELICKTKGW